MSNKADEISSNYNEMRTVGTTTISLCDDITSKLENILNTCTEIVNHCTKLDEYHNQYAYPKLEAVEYGLNEIPSKYKWSTWYIFGQEEIETACSSLSDTITTLKSNIDIVSDTMQNVINLADEYEETDQLVYQILEDEDSAKNKAGMARSFDSIQMNIATDEYKAARGEFVDNDKVQKQWWIDKPLYFEESNQVPGSYLIWQQDSNGNWTGMGWTDEASKKAYMDVAKHAIVGTGIYMGKDKNGTYTAYYDVKNPSDEPEIVAGSGTYRGKDKNGTYTAYYDVKNPSDEPKIVYDSDSKETSNNTESKTGHNTKKNNSTTDDSSSVEKQNSNSGTNESKENFVKWGEDFTLNGDMALSVENDHLKGLFDAQQLNNVKLKFNYDPKSDSYSVYTVGVSSTYLCKLHKNDIKLYNDMIIR